MNSPRVDRNHGSPYDRGSADRYYGRARIPHCYTGDSYTSELVLELLPEEIAEYNLGYDECTEEKVW